MAEIRCDDLMLVRAKQEATAPKLDARSYLRQTHWLRDKRSPGRRQRGRVVVGDHVVGDHVELPRQRGQADAPVMSG
jgi:hypothetical protein